MTLFIRITCRWRKFAEFQKLLGAILFQSVSAFSRCSVQTQFDCHIYLPLFKDLYHASIGTTILCFRYACQYSCSAKICMN